MPGIPLSTLMKVLQKTGGQGKNIMASLGDIMNPASRAMVGEGGKMGAIKNVLKANPMGAGAIGGTAALGGAGAAYGAHELMEDDEPDLESILANLKKKGGR
jgi:hypothetical protein